MLLERLMVFCGSVNPATPSLTACATAALVGGSTTRLQQPEGLARLRS
ncbi:MAG: hypothetical protein ACK5N0_06735 [Synechococcaceae cyanobacterium]